MEKYIEREALLAHLRECKETSTGSDLTAAVITAIQSFVDKWISRLGKCRVFVESEDAE